MKKDKYLKINLRSSSGFTMADLAMALFIIMLFVGLITSLFYSSYKLDFQIKMTADATNYAMMILEDIDKIPYEDVKSSLANSYITKYSIPSGFKVKLDVKSYNEGTDKEDIIKKVKLSITYTLQEHTEELVVNKLKIKEL